MGKKKIAHAVAGANSKMVHAVLAAHTAAPAPPAPAPAAPQTDPRGGGGGKKKGGTESVSRLCANPDCRKADATQQCLRCRRVVYCSRRCQKVHWGTGGHK